MGTETLPRRFGRIDASFFNLLRSILSGDLVPRASTGAPNAGSGSLGTSTLQWLRAHIASGHWSPGDIKEHHTYGGNFEYGQGFMVCDGRQITPANYDLEHGAGSWETYIGSSPLENKYLPNLIDRFPVGAAATPANGSSPIPSVGNPLNQLDLSHTHQWFKSTPDGQNDQTFDASGTTVDLPVDTTTLAPGAYTLAAIFSAGGAEVLSNDQYVKRGLSNTEDISPDGIEVLYCARII